MKYITEKNTIAIKHIAPKLSNEKFNKLAAAYSINDIDYINYKINRIIRTIAIIANLFNTINTKKSSLGFILEELTDIKSILCYDLSPSYLSESTKNALTERSVKPRRSFCVIPKNLTNSEFSSLIELFVKYLDDLHYQRDSTIEFKKVHELLFDIERSCLSAHLDTFNAIYENVYSEYDEVLKKYPSS